MGTGGYVRFSRVMACLLHIRKTLAAVSSVPGAKILTDRAAHPVQSFWRYTIECRYELSRRNKSGKESPKFVASLRGFQIDCFRFDK